VTVAELSAKIRWEPGNAEAIKANREHIEAAVAEAKAQLDAVRAIASAARKLCKHPSRYSSNWCGRDPGGGGCDDCGETW